LKVDALIPATQHFPSHHPQIAQREQHGQPRRVLRQSAIAHLGMAKLLLDDPERMLDLGADAGLDPCRSSALNIMSPNGRLTEVLQTFLSKQGMDLRQHHVG
jgi:hypothetical protein